MAPARQLAFCLALACTLAAMGCVHLAPTEAWDNHFAAFGTQDIDKIMLDYDENSLVRLHNDMTSETSQFKGLFEIRTMYAGAFGDLEDLVTFSAPVINVDEKEKQVFMTWKCRGCGYDNATDTFIFAGKNKIIRQNVVVTFKRMGNKN